MLFRSGSRGNDYAGTRLPGRQLCGGFWSERLAAAAQRRTLDATAWRWLSSASPGVEADTGLQQGGRGHQEKEGDDTYYESFTIQNKSPFPFCWCVSSTPTPQAPSSPPMARAGRITADVAVMMQTAHTIKQNGSGARRN